MKKRTERDRFIYSQLKQDPLRGPLLLLITFTFLAVGAFCEGEGWPVIVAIFLTGICLFWNELRAKYCEAERTWLGLNKKPEEDRQ